MKKVLVLLSGGIGTRVGAPIPKQYIEINGKAIVNHLLDNVINLFDTVIVVRDSKYNDHFSKYDGFNICR